MFDRSKIENNEKKFEQQINEVNNLLKATSTSYTNGAEFYKDYNAFVYMLSSKFEELQTWAQTNLAEQANKQEACREKAKKDGDFARDAEEFLRAKTQELVKNNKAQEELKAKMKESLTPLDVKKFAKLKVKETEQLNRMFATFFRVFYKDSAEQFDWAKFKKICEKDKLEDFQTRLVNVEFDKLEKAELDSLLAFKEDPWYDNYAKTDKTGAPLVELLNYLEWVKSSAETEVKIKALTNEIHKIKTDAPLRGESSKNSAAYADLLQESLNHLENLNARMVKAAEPFAQEATRTREQIDAFYQHQEKMDKLVKGNYENVRWVPRNVYADS